MKTTEQQFDTNPHAHPALPQHDGWEIRAYWFEGYEACPEGYYPAEPARWKYNASRLDGGRDGAGCFALGYEDIDELMDFVDRNSEPC